MHKFMADFKPDLRVHLGDFLDTTAWRSGAHNNPDEGSDIASDFTAGASFLRRFRPNLVFLGNHDHRPFKFLEHPAAIVRAAAEGCVRDITNLITVELGAEMVPYHILSGWRLIGGTAFGHGYMYNENAARDHAEMLGRGVVMAHIHTLSVQPGRCLGAPSGISAGLMADIPKLEYASTRRSTARWLNGWVYGEYSDSDIQTFLHPVRLGRSDIPVAGAA